MESSIKITDIYPIELHYIKALFLHRRYRRCIQACRHAINSEIDQQPLHHTFVSFYLGLAHDELARLMHDYSQAKVPAFNQAEQFFRDALLSLPSIEDIVFATQPDRRQSTSMADDASDPFLSRPKTNEVDHQTPRPSDDDYDPYNYSSPSFNLASPVTSPNCVHTEGSQARSPPSTGSGTSQSDLSDLESHASFRQIMTPNRVLERDISSMSLIDDMQPKRPSGLPRTTSTSVSLLQNLPTKPSTGLPRTTSGYQGILNPFRPDSPPKAFAVPPRLPYVDSAAGRHSKMLKIATRATPQITPSKQMREPWTDEERSSPVSPLKDDYDGASDSSTISPISPETPIHQDSACGTESNVSPAKWEEMTPERQRHRLDYNLIAMRTQLASHLDMLEKAKTATVEKQAVRAAERAASTAPSVGTPLPQIRGSFASASSDSRPGSRGTGVAHDSSTSGESRCMQQTRSFWSFKPAAVMAEEKRRRIEEGRQRGWKKARFRPDRYQELAERALAEL